MACRFPKIRPFYIYYFLGLPREFTMFWRWSFPTRSGPHIFYVLVVSRGGQVNYLGNLNTKMALRFPGSFRPCTKRRPPPEDDLSFFQNSPIFTFYYVLGLSREFTMFWRWSFPMRSGPRIFYVLVVSQDSRGNLPGNHNTKMVLRPPG